MTEIATPQQIERPRRGRRAFRRLLIAGGVFLLVLVALYARLLFGPISLDFLSDRVQSMVAGVVDDDYAVQWQEFGLSLTSPVSLGFRLSDVELTEKATNASMVMEALDISFSPYGMMFGRPSAHLTLVEPHIQMVQDLLGPRMSRLEFIETPGQPTTVRVLEGEASAPVVAIGQEGLSFDFSGADGPVLRSDNDWLIYNMQAMNAVLADFSRQALTGQVSRVSVRDGTVGVLDTVYGLFKEFEALDVDIRSGREDGRVAAIFSAEIADRVMHGTIARRLVEGRPQIDAEIENIDFSTIIPFLDDAQGIAALRGAGSLGLSIAFDDDGVGVEGGRFALDLTGTDLRLNHDLFAVRTEPFEVYWEPEGARFYFDDVDIAVGQSRGNVGGDLVLGFDAQFGPTLGISIRAQDVWLHPDDLEAPEEPFDSFTFDGWSAPLYGALGIDRMVGAKDGVSIVMQGRLDALREGIGLNVRISGRGASADDMKRLWPHIFAPEARYWFTEYVIDGTVETADMHFNFPVGTMSTDQEVKPIPEGGMTIDLVGNGVQLQPFEGLPQFEVTGESRVTVRDNQFTMAFESGRVPGEAGDVHIANAAFINQDTSASEQVFEISGDISGTVPALVRIANREPLNLLKDFQFGVDLDELASDVMGEVSTTVIATIATDDTGRMMGTDYALNGTVSDLHSVAPIQGFDFSRTNVSFTASQEGFRVVGAGAVEDMPLEIQATKSGAADPEILVATTLTIADAEKFGLDLSEFMGGQARVIARPLPDGRFQLSADLTNTSLSIKDIGVNKPSGVPGSINGIIAMDSESITVSDVDLAFGDVRLIGNMDFSATGALMAADFSTFQISPGDSARVTMAPTSGGFSLAISGEQLDIKPVLKRFFNLEGDGDAAPSDDLENQVFDVSVELDRALGYFGSAAFNVDLDLSVRGSELRRVNLAAQLGGGRTVSATTNPTQTGRVISYAANDVGAILRFIGIYPRLVEGDGTLVMRYNSETRTDTGEFQIRNFAVVDEGNLDQIVGSHNESRQALAGRRGLNFDFGRAEFVRFPDRIEVVEAALYGDTVGGTIRGNILTQQGRYDLAGTYVPLFGLNNVFQQLPILGPIFGGREGEGLLGVTFAVRGPLNDPDLLINPVSILAPGVFRSLFEYRAATQAPGN